MKRKFVRQARLPRGAYDLNLDLATSLERLKRQAEERRRKKDYEDNT